MGVTMAGQGASRGRAGIGDRFGSIWRDDVDIKVDEPLSRYIPIDRSEPVTCVASRAREAVIDVLGVLREARVGDDAREIVALSAECVGAIDAQVRVGKEVGDLLPGKGGLAEFVTPLQNVRPPGTVRTVRRCAPAD